MERALSALLGLMMVTMGCVGALDDVEQASTPDVSENDSLEEITRVQERHELNFTIDEGPSETLVNGTYDILAGVGINVDVELPATEGGGAATGSADVHMGVFLPDIPGCDWGIEDGVTVTPEGQIGNEDLPEKCNVPVVADIGPYYSTTEGAGTPQLEGDNPATEPSTRLGGFLIEQLVPHGYAVAQVSVFGTGNSDHCMDLMGDSEQAGIDGAVEALGEASFSNGNVGLTGRSYDGTTPWEAASTKAANDHLKTIAPISGLTGLRDLMWRNGSAESRGGTGLLWGLYYGFAPDGDAGDAEHVTCPDATLQGAPQHLAAWGTGGDLGPADQAYFAERDGFFEDALENYNGSVYYIHGMQDWNVDPHMAFDQYDTLIDNGFEVKGLFGQWDHAYPDRRSNHEDLEEGYGEEAFPATVRHDWAQDMLEWFDHYLKEEGEQPQLHAEIQDNQGFWRVEDTYPPQDRQAVELPLSDAEVVEGTNNVVGAEQRMVYEFGPIDENEATRLAGLHQFHPEVVPTGPGGQLFAELRDADSGLRLGHAVMDLRYNDGGDELQPVVPGQPLTAKMQFEAFDVVLPADHGLELVVTQTGMDYLPPSVSDPVMIEKSSDSVLRLFETNPPAEDFFLPPGLSEHLGDGVPDDVQANASDA